MAHRVLNGVSQLATGTGAGALTLGTVTDDIYQTLAAAGITNGDTTYVRIQHEDIKTEWEIVLVTFTAPSTITRTFEGKSESPTDDLINFSAGNKIVSSVIIADQVAAIDPDDNVALPGALDVVDTAPTAENLATAYIVANLAALKALTSRPPIVYMCGRSTMLDGGEGFLAWKADDSTTADDALVVQCTSGASGRYFRYRGDGAGIPEWWGTGVGAFQDALDSGLTLIRCRPGVTYQVGTTGIVIPGGVTLDLNGATINGDASCAAVVTFGTSGQNVPIQFRNGTVTRSGGAPSTSTIGVDVVDGYRHVINNIWSDNHGVPWNFRSSVGATAAGISCRLTDCDAGRASDAFIVADTWPELYWQGGRIGSNGETDYACSAYVRITGGEGGSGSGPNSIKFSMVQFNCGGGASWQPAHCVEFVSRDAGADGVQELFEFVQCHFEGYTSAAIHSDSSWPWITGLRLTSCCFNSSGPDFFDLHVNTSIRLSSFVGCELRGSSFEYGPTATDRPTQMFSIIECHILGPMVISTLAAGSAMKIIGGNYAGLTLAGNWNSFEINSQLAAGSIDISAALGNVTFSDPQFTQGSFTPQLAFGGASVGITYSLQNAYYQINGRECTVVVSINLSSKGSSTGLATIGLPFASATGRGGGGSVDYFSSMASLSGHVSLAINPAEGVAFFLMAAATGQSSVTDANFTDTTQFRAVFTYFLY